MSAAEMQPTAIIAAVNKSPDHRFSKATCRSITLIAGHGIEGDAHAGDTVKHRSRVAIDPNQPNLRQVHLIHAELHHELKAKGFDILPGEMGENITTRGLDLLALPRATLLEIGPDAIIEVTGLRNPCKQLDDHQQGLTQAVLDRSPDGELVRKAGVMAVVRAGGVITTGDSIRVTLPEGPHERLVCV